jgi:DNA-binding TFAR19-related protein (PDSD5 family)
MPGAAEAVPAFDSEWLDDMVKKLQAELQRQLDRVQKAGEDENDARTRAADARTLAVLERTLGRLALTEQARALARETKIHKPNARDALERRLDKLAAAEQKTPDS